MLVNPACLGCSNFPMWHPNHTKATLKMRQGLRRCRNKFGTWSIRNGPLMQVWVFPYTLALLKCEFKIPVSSVYEATKIDLQGSGMAISKIIDQGPQGHWFRKIACPLTPTIKLRALMLKLSRILPNETQIEIWSLYGVFWSFQLAGSRKLWC